MKKFLKRIMGIDKLEKEKIKLLEQTDPKAAATAKGEAYIAVIDTQVNRIVDVMKSISHCCGHIESVDKEGKPIFKKRAIYDTTFERAKALVNTIKNFRPTDNEQSIKLQSAVDDLEKVIGGVSTELLRESDSTREDVKQGIDEILSKFN